ncbi:MAG: arginase [Sarcina ventriculi]|nr:arginase [Sarcina ventriculi]
MNINMIGVPLFYGCDNPGVEKGPDTLRENNIIDIFKNNNNKIYDLGNLYVKHIDSCDKFADNKNMKYLSSVIDVNENLAQVIYNSLNANNFPLVIGGDHSLGLGSLAGVSKHFNGDFGVIWVDAHGDINTDLTSPSGNIHGMPLAASMGVGNKSLQDIYFKGRKVDPKKVFILCARDLDEGELELINSLKLNVWTSKSIKEKGIERCIEELLNRVYDLNIKNIHLSFDIDCANPDLVPGTGTPVKDGICMNEAKYIIDSLFKTKMIKSMDFVEFNPDIEYTTTLNNCLDLLKCVAKSMQ